ncbi:hypothetical protein PoB_004551600 [Plakobranchus ocellatus]|uniref:Uncharacterized protein n=1 Tax=Plakobranchus ocellatus TaxID=259542 RepID=A0AAV4BF13_9GAST|nr:hypothetical protein PoB_004551600 [Plakobranchus ocellatus]
MRSTVPPTVAIPARDNTARLKHRVDTKSLPGVLPVQKKQSTPVGSGHPMATKPGLLDGFGQSQCIWAQTAGQRKCQ